MDTDRWTVRRVSACALVVLLPLLTLASTPSDLLTVEASPVAAGQDPSPTAPGAAPIPAAAPLATSPADPAILLADPVTGASLSTRTTSGTAPGTLPPAAQQAYLFATRMINAADPQCGLDWSLLAAIGSVESDHGRTGGAVLGDDGVSSTRIRGVRLDGTGPVARILDTDAGALDGDRRYDRALGPMQFLPATWASVGVDADGDGIRDVHDLDDAALGAAVYLCSGPGTLATPTGLRAALHRYNPSDSYVDTVAARAAAYDAHGIASPTLTLVARPVSTALPASTVADEESPAEQPGKKPGKKPRWEPGTTVTATLGPEPVETSAPPEPTPPEPTPPEPTPPAPTDEPVEPAPLDLELTGMLAPCGEDWCLDEQLLDVGDRAFRATEALSDLDADGAVETNQAELEGLTGTTVVLRLESTHTVPLVRQINGQAYRTP